MLSLYGRYLSRKKRNRCHFLRLDFKNVHAGEANTNMSIRLLNLVNSFRIRGHFAANLDPLEKSNLGTVSRNPERRVRWLPEDPKDAPDVVRLLHSNPTQKYDLSVFDLASFPLADEYDLGTTFRLGKRSNGCWSIDSLVSFLSECYCGSVGIELGHIESESRKLWLIDKIESEYGPRKWGLTSPLKQLNTLDRLIRSDHLEKFLGSKFASSKRFGIEGCESLLPGLWSVLEAAVPLGLEGVEMGMAHRGRLNVLHNFVGKSLRAMCNEFSETELLETGDVKYHLGTRGEVTVTVPVEEDRHGLQGRSHSGSKDHGGKLLSRVVHLSLAANPSHLEAVNPVVIGKTKAKQFYVNDHDRRRVMPIILHGDAAFSGQGIVPEVMELSELPDYTVGGCVHIIINNQIGFTTDPRRARSSYHCTNPAKGIEAPIFHVNGDDVDAVVSVCELAATYRQTFGQDCVVDIICYRRHGHNELDDPLITQPLTYQKIKQHPTTLEIYKEKLMRHGIIGIDMINQMSEEVYKEFEKDYEMSRSYRVDPKEWLASNWQGRAIGSMIQERPYNQTGVSAETLLKVGYALCYLPDDMVVHPEVVALTGNRRRMLDSGRGFNMAFAEALAFGTLMTKYSPPSKSNIGSLLGRVNEVDKAVYEGDESETDRVITETTINRHRHGLRGLDDNERTLSSYDESIASVAMQEHPTVHVRLSGQDCMRGTFNQRHAAIYCQETSREYIPLNNMARVAALSGQTSSSSSNLQQATFSVCNSSLSETAVLGFEFGYSLSNEMALTIWEAQFGDFANVAQMIIDNFIVSGESKWNRYSGSALVMLLPHGFDGQGPEHSSARLERFLQLTDDDPDEIPGKGDAASAELLAGFDALDRHKHGRIRREDFRDFLIKHSMVDDIGHRIDLAIAEIFSEAGREDDDFVTRQGWINLMSAWLQRNSERRINICVVQPSTPSQYFHVLRRQIHRPYAKPLIVMSPKWLLHHKRCTSSIDEFLQGTFFQRVIIEDGRGDNMKSAHLVPPEQIKRVIFCSGKIFYHLYHARRAANIRNIALVRIEQIAPFPYDLIGPAIQKYPNADIVWCQEEPKNMGGWSYVKPRFDTTMRDLQQSSNGQELLSNLDRRNIVYIGRKSSASAATGSYKVHVAEMKEIMDKALNYVTSAASVARSVADID